MTLAAKDKEKEKENSSSQPKAEPKGAERRRCKRLPITFPIEVSGIDSTGGKFCDRTVTSDVSAEGCRFDFLRNLKRGTEITILLVPRDADKPATGTPLRFLVVWVETSDWGWSIGAEKLQPENIWHMAFPKLKVPGRSSR